jgi:streptogramin lyase
MPVRCRRLFVAFLLLLTACSHAGVLPQTPPPGGTNAIATTHGLIATIVVRIPKAMVGEDIFPALMHQAFVAASTRGALVRVYERGKDKHPIASIAANLSATSKDCKKTSKGRTCSIAVDMPAAGTYDFSIDTYDKAPKHGTFQGAKHLAVGFATDKIAKSRIIGVVLGGIVASTQTAFGKASTPAIDPFSASVLAVARDADGNVIVTDKYVDKRGKAVTLTMTGGAGAGTTLAFTPPSFDKPSSVTMKYTPAVMSSAQASSGFATSLIATATNGAPPSGPTLTFTAPKMHFYPITTSNSSPLFITSGSDGAMWFSEFNVNQIGRINTAGSIHEYPATSTGAQPKRIIRGPDGNEWFVAQSANTINRITANGVVTSFPIPTANSSPEGLTVGRDGNFWFTEHATPSKIGRVSSAGTGFVEFTLASTARPYGITNGPDGALWFAEEGTNQIGRITTSGSPINSYSSSMSTLPYVVVAGTDGALWFGGCSNYIGRMTTAGVVTTTQIRGTGEAGDITVGPDGAIWFTVSTIPSETQSVARISNGVVTYYNVPGSNPYPSGITTGPDGAIWFLELNANQVVRLQ